MRITNKMMNNTNLSNINKNKEYLDKLNNQLASEKKITRPSDDPIVAIRALKLRSNLTEITQYYDKNVKDATSWLTATQDAIESTQKMVTSMRALFTQGSNATNSSESRAAIIKELNAYKNQIYDDGNADYAGRSLFTGFRTGTRLTFSESDAKLANYTGITEKLTVDDMEEITYISNKVKDIETLSSALTSTGVNSTDLLTENKVKRFRLAYNNVDLVTSFSVKTGTTTDTYPVTTKEIAVDKDGCYTPIGDNDVFLIKETGELILGKNVAESIASDSEISAIYNKKKWNEGDLIPENYFECTKNTADGPINYDETANGQIISYDISSNQKIDVNTTCDELYNPAIGRDLDEILKALNEYNDALEKVEKLKDYISNYDASDSTQSESYLKLKQVLDAAEKEVDATKEKIQSMFEHYQTKFDGYIKQTTTAATENGTRISRVELVKNRLLDLKTTANTLADENENVELTDVATQVSEAELVYQAALMATGKVSQVTLLNYI